MISAKGIYFSFNSRNVLKDVSFEIDKGNFVAILGPNGAGKTTLLKIIIGLLKPDRGSIRVMGRDPYEERDELIDKIAYLPQRENISNEIPLKVHQVLSIPYKARNLKISKKRLLEVLSEVGLEEKINSRFNELSGGQQQRILLARALMSKPEILLLDEPFNGVDVPSQEKIVEILDDLSKKGTTVVVVVHNVNLLLHYINKVMLLNRKIIAFGEPNNVFTEENIVKAYGSSIPLVICEEGFTHPLYGDYHG